MFREEAQWIAQKLSTLDIGDGADVLDIGSSNLEYRTVIQPHVDRYIHQPLLSRGAHISFLDMKPHEGVDLVVDLSLPGVDSDVFDRKFDLIICCNILEHVADRDVFMRNLARFARPGSRIMLTVPRLYPRHNDPIDTMYRPSVKSLEGFVNRHLDCNRLAAEEFVIDDREYYVFRAGRWRKRLTFYSQRMMLRWYIRPLRWRVTGILLEVKQA